jgi:SseB protein C-terminal domain/SseB protein N-terminal domain
MNPVFEPTNLLEVALRKAADDPASRPLFLRELLDSKVLIVPAGEKPRIVDGVVPQDTKIGIANIEFGGRQCVPFFTSEARLPGGTEFLVLEAKALFQITRGAYLVMNPGVAYGKEFYPDEVARLLDGTAFQPKERYVAEKAVQVVIGQPKDYPKELVEALARLYASIPAVKRAWVAFYHNPERDTEGGLLIALDVPGAGDMERISGESGIVIESVPKKQKFVDLVRYEKSGVAGYFTDQKPFYQKSLLGDLWSKLRG